MIQQTSIANRANFFNDRPDLAAYVGRYDDVKHDFIHSSCTREGTAQDPTSENHCSWRISRSNNPDSILTRLEEGSVTHIIEAALDEHGHHLAVLDGNVVSITVNDGRPISGADFSDCIRIGGLQEGDRVTIHSDHPVLYVIGPSQFRDPGDPDKLLVSIESLVGRAEVTTPLPGEIPTRVPETPDLTNWQRAIYLGDGPSNGAWPIGPGPGQMFKF